MSSVAQLIEELASAGVRIWTEDGKLRYRAPAGVMTSDLLASLKSRREEILRHIEDEAHIPALPEQPDYEISHAQRRLWILSNIEQGSSAYNVPLHQLIEGDLDRNALQRAFDELVRRHDSLRTTFEIRNDEPRQIIHRPGAAQFEYVDLAEAGREAALEIARHDSSEPFDLVRGPLFRVKLMRTAAAEHVLSITLHHLVCDGVSVAVLAAELSTLYSAYAAGNQSPLAPLRIQYRDFAHWQNRQLAGPAASAHREYWKSKLREPYPLLNLPLDSPRPREQSFEGREISLVLLQDRFGPLVRLAQASGSSLFVVLVALVKTLLYRYTGQDDIVVGSPFAGQNHPDLEGQIGFYINMLPLRDKVTGEICFRNLVKQVRSTVSEAFEHQMWPFDLMVNDLALPRDLGRSPLFDVAVILQSQRDEALAMPGLCARSCFEHPGTSKFDLTFCFKEVSDRLIVSIEYATALFSDARMERMARHVEQLAASIGDRPDDALDALEILPNDEHQFAIRSQPGAGSKYDGSLFLNCFERHVAQNPDRIAVISGKDSSSVTYGELNRKAEQVAAYLQSQNIGADDLVTVQLPRNLDLPVALLGILKAGAAYVPLDPSMPVERLRLILEDARPSCHITPEFISRGLNSARAFRRSEILVENLAYVIYTSGSTGRPKGVAITHRSLDNFLTSMQRSPGLTEKDVLLAVTTVSFDIAALELLLPLMCGARIVLADEDAVIDGTALHALIAEHRVTVLQATPATWRMLLSAEWTSSTHLRAFCGGEALPAQLASLLSEHCSELWNLYGPTETTVWSAALRVTPEMRTQNPVPVGTPVDSTALYVMNPRYSLQPIGVPGQLFIGGDGLARGYFQNPRLTAEKFVPDPFASGSGARMYATGDLVQLTDNGCFSFLGRIDHQLKIRGFRIEPGEIESALVTCSKVREAIVGVSTSLNGEAQLTAWVTASNHDSPPSPQEMRQFVATRLPDYMIPQAIVVVQAWPLNPNGKVDRKALPAPAAQGRERELSVSRRVATLPEEILCQLFAEILNHPAVHPEDDFFGLGGHSLLALRLANRIRDVFHSELPIRTIFDASTPREIALRLKNAEQTPLLAAASERPAHIPLSWAQSRLWFLHRVRGEGGSWNISAALRLDGAIDYGVLDEALNDLVDRHEILRTLVDDSSPDPAQRILPRGANRLKIMREDLEEGQLAARVEALAAEPIAIEHEIPIRAHLLRLAADRHVLFLVVHHIAADAWSLGVLASDLSRAWSARQQKLEPDFSPLPVQYADYALWQKIWMGEASESWQRQMMYWQTALAALPEEIVLPVDRPRPAKPTFRGEKVPVHISAELHRKLLALARRNHATLFMVLEAGLAALLHRLGSGFDIPIGVPVSGRTQSVLDDVVGLFVNTLVIRNDLSRNPSFLELLDRVRITLLDAFSNQDVPFDALVAQVLPSRSMTAHPLFQVMLSLQNVPQGNLTIPGVSISQQQVTTRTAKFDLSINLDEVTGPDGDPAGIHGELEFSTDLFDRKTAESIVNRFVLLLERAERDPSRSISRLSILLPGEGQLLLKERNQNRRVWPERTLVDLLEEQASNTPEAPALVFGPTTLSYSELNARANQLARCLISRGVAPEVLCGICMERSIEALVAILAVLKAGGTYVPLDPAYPEARLALILSTARPSIVLCTRATLSMVPANLGVLVVDLPETREALAEYSTARIEEQERIRPLLPANAAYSIYTSGSEGQPKGIQVPHEAVVNLVHAVIHLTAIDGHSRMLQFASFNFDASVLELFPAWACGACIVLAGGDDRNPEQLRVLLRDGRVTHFFLTPAVLASIDPDPAFSVECIMFGGEPCPEEVAARWSAAYRSFSVYGPTETTAIVSASDVLHGTDTPIGRPMINSRLYVLNTALQTVPQGVEGELFIGGAGVARGYLGDPRQTAAKFVPDPFADAPGARMYRSGDAVRYRPDGQLDFLRRLDDQVKIRGNRIELHDIEIVIESHPDVVHAAALAVKGLDDRPTLVAFVVPRDKSKSDSHELHRFLRERLPDYMVPSGIAILDRLPLGPTGKIDRKALMEVPPTFFSHESVSPRDEAERVLADIFAEVLRRERVGVTDSFFELGGHSLLATQVTSRIRRVFGVTFPLDIFFEKGSVESVAAHLRSTETAPGRTAKIARIYEKVKNLSDEERAELLRAKSSPDPAATVG